MLVAQAIVEERAARHRRLGDQERRRAGRLLRSHRQHEVVPDRPGRDHGRPALQAEEVRRGLLGAVAAAADRDWRRRCWWRLVPPSSPDRRIVWRNTVDDPRRAGLRHLSDVGPPRGGRSLAVYAHGLSGADDVSERDERVPYRTLRAAKSEPAAHAFVPAAACLDVDPGRASRLDDGEFHRVRAGRRGAASAPCGGGCRSSGG